MWFSARRYNHRARKTWMAGYRRAGATPSYRRLCPVMTEAALPEDSPRLPSFSERRILSRAGLDRQQIHCHLPSKQRRYCYFCQALDTPCGRGHIPTDASDFGGTKVPQAPQESTSCSKQSFYSGARRRGSGGVLPSSSRSRPRACRMSAFNQATPACAAASGVNLSEKHAPVGLRFSTVMAAECNSAIRWTIESPSPVLPGLLRSRRQNR
jgi:hypothetical protein